MTGSKLFFAVNYNFLQATSNECIVYPILIILNYILLCYVLSPDNCQAKKLTFVKLGLTKDLQLMIGANTSSQIIILVRINIMMSFRGRIAWVTCWDNHLSFMTLF